MREDKPPVEWWRANAEGRAYVAQLRQDLHEVFVEPIVGYLEVRALLPASVERLRKALAAYDADLKEE